nr:MAG TPA: hypothetical protein [Caudoviricetes sp.]
MTQLLPVTVGYKKEIEITLLKIIIVLIAFPLGFFLIGRHYSIQDKLLAVFTVWLSLCVVTENIRYLI